jgi:hypothetical protein
MTPKILLALPTIDSHLQRAMRDVALHVTYLYAQPRRYIGLPASYTMGTGALSPVAKRPGREAGH